MKRLAVGLALVSALALLMPDLAESNSARDYSEQWIKLSRQEKERFYDNVFQGMLIMCEALYSTDGKKASACLEKIAPFLSKEAYAEYMELFEIAYIEKNFPHCPFGFVLGEWIKARYKGQRVDPMALKKIDDQCRQENENSRDLNEASRALEELRK